MTSERIELYLPPGAKESGRRWRCGAAEGLVYEPSGALGAELEARLETCSEARLWVADIVRSRTQLNALKMRSVGWLVVVGLGGILLFIPTLLTGVVVSVGLIFYLILRYRISLRTRRFLDRAIAAFNTATLDAGGPRQKSSELAELQLDVPRWYWIGQLAHVRMGAYETKATDKEAKLSDSFKRLVEQVPATGEWIKKYYRLRRVSYVLQLAAGVCGIAFLKCCASLPLSGRKVQAGLDADPNIAVAAKFAFMGLLICLGLALLLRRDRFRVLAQVVEAFNAGRNP